MTIENKEVIQGEIGREFPACEDQGNVQKMHITPAEERVAAFIARHKQSRWTDPEIVHSYDVGCDGETALTVSDIEALLAGLVELRGEVSWGVLLQQAARRDALDEAFALARRSINDGGMARSMAMFADVSEWRTYKDACLKYADAIAKLIDGGNMQKPHSAPIETTEMETEAVEAAAHALEQNASKWMHGHSMRNAAATLRALATERVALKAQLAAERALADDLAGDLKLAYLYDADDDADEPASLDAHRKARGL